MKQNSQKILLLSYGLASVPVTTFKEVVSTIVPTLTPSGISSLIQYLRKRQYIYIDAYTNLISLTQQGIKAVEGLFPAFGLQNEPILLLFLTPPKYDPQFRTLRRIVLAHHLKQVTRGVYLSSGKLTTEVTLTLERLYGGHVIAIKMGDWVFGDKKSVLAAVFDETALYRTYSGISRDIEQVTSNSIGKKTLTEQSKEKIFSAFSLFFNTIQTDSRLKNNVSRQTPEPRELLASFQKVLFYRPT